MTTPLPHNIVIREAASSDEIDLIRTLFREYQQALWVSLCFQGFDAELAALPGDYAPPNGTLLLALRDGQPIGCVAMRPLVDVPGQAREAELKRLYLRPSTRGLGLGRHLACAAIDAARHAGYARIRLDTLSTMEAAQALYAQLGFVETAAYCYNPLPGVRYMALELTPGNESGSAKLPPL